MTLPDWTERVSRVDKVGAIDQDAPAILTRLNIDPEAWRATMRPGNCFGRALGQFEHNRCLDMERFTPHDLRRTAASLMTSAGTPRRHVEKVLNHTIDDVAEIYDRHHYTEEKRAALVGLHRVIVQSLPNVAERRTAL